MVGVIRADEAAAMTERKEFVVYLSSTLADLKAERDIALKTIAEVGVVKTSYRAADTGAIKTCTGDVRASHLYVGILGQRYGYVPPAAEGNPDGKSITELEYEACQRPGGPPISRLMFIKSTEAGILPEHIDALSYPQTAAQMKAFLTRANQNQTAFLFKNSEEFRAEVRIRVGEHADRFHRSKVGEGSLFGGGQRWKRQLAPVAVGCVPGTDEAQRAALAALGAGRFVPFELSPDDAAYLATLDAGLALAQLGALLVTPASLARLTSSGGVQAVKAGIAMLADRSGHAILIAEGIPDGTLPPEWAQATQLTLPAGALTAPDAAATLTALYERLRAVGSRLTLEPRLALPYVVIAPTLQQALTLADPAGASFSGFKSANVQMQRKAEFARIAAASRAFDPNWPNDLYGEQRHDWKCFGAQSMSADAIVRHAVDRVNAAPAGSRERRFLKTAHLLPRRYRLDEYLDDSLGSRKAILAARDSGCLFIVDELALLHPLLREAADALLVGTRTAIVALTPCDPSHSRIDDLLDDFSFLRVGSLITRFKTELDPRCEIALNNIGRIERWLRSILPDLVASAEDQESVPALEDRMQQVLAQ